MATDIKVVCPVDGRKASWAEMRRAVEMEWYEAGAAQARDLIAQAMVMPYGMVERMKNE